MITWAARRGLLDALAVLRETNAKLFYSFCDNAVGSQLGTNCQTICLTALGLFR